MNKPLKRTVFTLGIVLSIILIIFIVRFIYISVSNYKNAKINSIEELSSLLRVDIAGDSVFIKDITFKNTSYNTYVYVLYEVPESLIEKNITNHLIMRIATIFLIPLKNIYLDLTLKNSPM